MERHVEDLTGCEMAWSAGSITISGEIDAANAPVIEQRMRALLSAGNVVVDCRAVTFLDVAGLRMLAQLGVVATALSAVVRVLCSPTVTATVNLCGPHELCGLVLDHSGSSR